MVAAGEQNKWGGAERGAECEIENLTGSPCVVEGKCQSGKPIEPPVFNRLSLISAGGRRMEAKIRTILGVTNG